MSTAPDLCSPDEDCASGVVSVARTDVSDRDAVARAWFDHFLAGAIDEAGPLGDALRHHFEAPGSQTRSKLALEAGSILGLPDAVAAAIATACELLHNASLIHDDLQDRDRMRRGRPAVWARFGEDLAVNAGDLLIGRALEVAAKAPLDARQALQIVQAVAQATASAIRGQVEDNRARSSSLGLTEYEAVARAKTGALLALPVVASLAAAGATPEEQEATTRAFADLAVVYQMQDDLADLLGEKGRVAGSDLRTGRPNLVAILYRREIDEELETQLAAARGLAAEDPSALDALVGRVRTSRAVDEAISLAYRALGRALLGAASLPRDVQALFHDAALRWTERLDPMRLRRAQELGIEPFGELEIEVEVDDRNATEVVPVELIAPSAA